MSTDLAVIIVNYRTPDLSLESARSAALSSENFEGFRVIIVDGFSADGSVKKVREGLHQSPDERITLLELDVNGGFAFANNRGMMKLAEDGSLPRFIALINPDARVRPGALEAMAALLVHEPRAGAVGARLEHEDGRPQSSAFHFPSVRGEFARGARTGLLERLLRVPSIDVRPDHAAKVPWVAGTAVMFRTEALQQSGLFDEGFFLYFEETELMHRLAACGWDIWHEPAARVVHLGGVATQIRDPETGRLRRGRPAPRYWYESRRRYFALVHGRPGVLAAGFAWLAGRALWLIRCVVTRRSDDSPQRMTGDFIRYALVPRPRDTKPAVPGFDTAPNPRPAWQRSKPA